VNALAGTVQELFNDPEKRLAMGESGRQYALQHWDETRVLSSFEAHLSKTSGAPPSGEIAQSPASI
jgi:hypothetical protein